MKRFLFFVSLVVCWCLQAQPTGVSLTFNTIADMEAHTITASQTSVEAIVREVYRGGLFRLTTSAVAVDDGIAFTCTDATRRWIRQFDGPANALWWGATVAPLNDDTAALQAAATTCATLGIPLRIPEGVYDITAGIDVTGVTVFGDGPGKTIINLTRLVAGYAVGALYVTGSETDTGVTLSGTHKEGGNVLTLSGNVTTAIGDLYYLTDTDDYSYSGTVLNGARSTYHAGQQLISTNSATSSSIVMQESLWDTYDDGVKLYELDLADFEISEMTVTVDAECTRAIVLKYGTGSIRNVSLTGGNYDHVYIWYCRDVTVENVWVDHVDGAVNTGTNYGVRIFDSEQVSLHGCHMRTVNHGVAISGYSYPSRFVTVSDCVLESLERPAFDMHGMSEFVTITGNTMTGASVCGDRHVIANNIIVPYQPDLYIIDSSELSGTDIKFIGNTIYMPNGFSTDDYVAWNINIGSNYKADGAPSSDNCTKTNGPPYTLIGNTVYLSSNTNRNHFIYLDYALRDGDETGTPFRIAGLHVENNAFISDDAHLNVITNIAYAVWVNTERVSPTHLLFKDNLFQGKGVMIKSGDTYNVDFEGNVFRDTRYSSIYLTTGTNTSQNARVRIADNRFVRGYTAVQFNSNARVKAIRIENNVFEGPWTGGQAIYPNNSTLDYLGVEDNLFFSTTAVSAYPVYSLSTAAITATQLRSRGNEYVGTQIGTNDVWRDDILFGPATTDYPMLKSFPSSARYTTIASPYLSVHNGGGTVFAPIIAKHFFADSSTATAGNARGVGSQDLQGGRSAATQVASGTSSTVLGGTNNTASASYTTASGGYENTVSGTGSSVVGGVGNTNTSQYAVSGGLWNRVTGDYSTAFGYTNRVSGTAAFAAGYNNVASGNYSVALGDSNNSANSYSTAIGYQNTVTAFSSLGIGYGNVSQNSYTIAIGGSCVALGDSSVAIGRDVDARGTGSITLGRSSRNSGSYGTIVGGYDNTNTHAYTVSGGRWNTTTADYSTAFGYTNRVSGTAAFAAGYDNISSASYSVATGASANAPSYGKRAHAAGMFATQGDAQHAILVGRAVLTLAQTTSTNLWLDGSSTRIVLPANTSWTFRAEVVGRTTDAGTGDEESAAYTVTGLIERDNAAANTRIVGSVTTTTIAEDDAAWDATASADTTNGALTITVTGNNETTIRWVATIYLTEVGG